MRPTVLCGLQSIVRALESVQEKSCSQGIHCSRRAKFIHVLSQICPGSARVARAMRSRLDWLDKSVIPQPVLASGSPESHWEFREWG